MADVTAIPVDPRRLPTGDYDSGLSIPPFDADFFSLGDNQNDAAMSDLDIDFDFDFDDLYVPSVDDVDDLLNPINVQGLGSQFVQDANFPQFSPIVDQFHGVSDSISSESLRVSGDIGSSGDRSSNGSGSTNSDLQKISGYLNMPSPESNHETSGNCDGDVKVSNWPSPESQGSRNSKPNVSEDSNNCATKPVSSSCNLNDKPDRNKVVNKAKLEGSSKSKGNVCLLKRKKDSEDLPNNIKSSSSSDNSNSKNDSSELCEDDAKKKARLERNRESAQLSRQRKKHYVEELEEKVKKMHSTIQDLNVKISYFMAENATMRQQMGGGGVAPPPSMAPLPHGAYPHPAMMYPCMPYPPPYMMKHGSQVPLVPIPRLKPQQSKQSPKVSKKPQTKKVASVSFLGLLFFVMLFGGLAPMVKVRYGGVKEIVTGGGFYEKHHGRVLMVNGTTIGDGSDFKGKSSVHCDQKGHEIGGKTNPDEFVGSCNRSEPLVASLYVPRNDKMVKIDGNLIIHSVLASEKVGPSNGKGVGGDTGLAVPGNLGPIPVPSVRIDDVRHPQLKALLGSGLVDEVGKNPKATDGRVHQWFREGLAGPMLSSGMCTEVFQFEVSSASTSGDIVPDITLRNITEGLNRNSTRLSRNRNRRILRGLTTKLPEPSRNISRRNPQKNLNGTSSPMVVSVLVDPREIGDAEVDGVMGTKSVSRIFVVVLTNSIKYATYSCVLPFKGPAPHLVTT